MSFRRIIFERNIELIEQAYVSAVQAGITNAVVLAIDAGDEKGAAMIRHFDLYPNRFASNQEPNRALTVIRGVEPGEALLDALALAFPQIATFLQQTPDPSQFWVVVVAEQGASIVAHRIPD